jgi:hypothetical protein
MRKQAHWEVYVDSSGYAHDDEGNSWYVGDRRISEGSYFGADAKRIMRMDSGGGGGGGGYSKPTMSTTTLKRYKGEGAKLLLALKAKPGGGGKSLSFVKDMFSKNFSSGRYMTTKQDKYWRDLLKWNKRFISSIPAGLDAERVGGDVLVKSPSSSERAWLDEHFQYDEKGSSDVLVKGPKPKTAPKPKADKTVVDSDTETKLKVLDELGRKVRNWPEGATHVQTLMDIYESGDNPSSDQLKKLRNILYRNRMRSEADMFRKATTRKDNTMDSIQTSLQRLGAVAVQKTANLTNDDTLGQLLSMEVGSMYDDEPHYVDPPPAVEKAAKRYEDAVERALDQWVGKNLGQIALDEFSGADTDADEVVEVMLDERGGAAYLYFMEAEGHGVGTWDGDWDWMFADGGGRSISDLSKFVERATSREYQALKDALMAAADEYAIEEGLVDESEFIRSAAKRSEDLEDYEEDQEDVPTPKLARRRRRSRFEEGKPADPTKNMSPEEAAEWEEQNEENKDKFKTGDRLSASLERLERMSRFEEGKPADPTKNMSPEEAAEWEEQNDKNKDKFKTAARKRKVRRRIDARFPKGKPADPTANMSDEQKASWNAMNEEHRDKFKSAGHHYRADEWLEFISDGNLTDEVERVGKKFQDAVENLHEKWYEKWAPVNAPDLWENEVVDYDELAFYTHMSLTGAGTGLWEGDFLGHPHDEDFEKIAERDSKVSRLSEELDYEAMIAQEGDDEGRYASKRRARKPKGKKSDPTENMSEEDAQKFKDNQFKKKEAQRRRLGQLRKREARKDRKATKRPPKTVKGWLEWQE